MIVPIVCQPAANQTTDYHNCNSNHKMLCCALPITATEAQVRCNQQAQLNILSIIRRCEGGGAVGLNHRQAYPPHGAPYYVPSIFTKFLVNLCHLCYAWYMRDMNIRGVPDVTLVTWKKRALDEGLSLRAWVIGTLDLASTPSVRKGGGIQTLPTDEAPCQYPSNFIDEEAIRKNPEKYEHIKGAVAQTPTPTITKQQGDALIREAQARLEARKKAEFAKGVPEGLQPLIGSSNSRTAQAYESKYHEAPTPGQLETFIKKGW